eukprot:CAMPEP_0201928000 /NCGR_PEP_ID=MMETSP0903-20130614/19951_1 /ASSEMBLY_ACC=CAM_ASM_000552 /TAXON_ID=420261 /ORGANISM="Thalassiosira antarctica, Strain CCMP982" /LENGTH=289 /DNA_ID=CAMNT_0048466345 /DNA_START=79 /DNA_END=945 /DNA_ORIENTATION=+
MASSSSSEPSPTGSRGSASPSSSSSSSSEQNNAEQEQQERAAVDTQQTLLEDFGENGAVLASSAADDDDDNNDSACPAQDAAPPPAVAAPAPAAPATPTRRERNNDTTKPNNKSKNNNTTNPSSAIPSFTSESPYLSSYIDREMRNLVVLTETLRDISARARTFGKCGALMAEATRRLSSACRLNPSGSGAVGGNGGEGETGENDEQLGVINERRESVGEEMTSVLSVLGEILDEVADAQVSMCQSLEASLSLSLEAFAGVELNEATRLRSEADVMSENAESSFSKYMH